MHAGVCTHCLLGLFRLTQLCVCVKVRQRGKSSSQEFLSHMWSKYRVQRLKVCKGTDLEQFGAVHLYFLKLPRWPSPESCRPQSSLITRAVVLTARTLETFIKQYKCISTLL